MFIKSFHTTVIGGIDKNKRKLAEKLLLLKASLDGAPKRGTRYYYHRETGTWVRIEK